MPAKGKKKIVFDVLPEEHAEFMDRARTAGMSAIEYFRNMRDPLPRFHHRTRAAAEREKYIKFAMFFLELLYKGNGGLRTSRLGLEEEWNSLLDGVEDCIRALRALPVPGADEDRDPTQFPPNPSWIKSRHELLRSLIATPPGDQD